MTVRSYAGDAKRTTLSAGISNTALSFTVTAGGGTGYPTGAAGPFAVLFDHDTAGEEKVLCSARTGDTFTVQAGGRGYDDTIASSHGLNAAVDHVGTATDFREANAHVNDTTGDPHPQYLTPAEGDALFLTPAEGNAAYLGLGGGTTTGPIKQNNLGSVLNLLNAVNSTAGSASGAATGLLSMQAGTSVVTLDGSGNATLNFPSAFANGVVSVIPVNGDGTSQSNVTISVTACTLTGFTINVRSASTGAVVAGGFRCNWIAVGG